jgi:phosphoribosylanthranilate isomerase
MERAPIRSVRVKVCGITRVEDLVAAAEAGVDAVGPVFYPGSRRALTVEQGAALAAAAPPFLTLVGLFVDASPNEVRAVLERVPLDQLQLHGDESPDYCAAFQRPYIKAIRVREGVDLQRAARDYAGARALLLDTYRPGVPGGTGETFDWSLIPARLERPVVLAGGLNPTNVIAAVRAVAPAAVDVSGGVEVAKGVKDAALIREFMRGIERV